MSARARLLKVVLNQHRLRLARYERELRSLEARFGMESATFAVRFEAGDLGDATDYFEWAGLVALRQDLLEKVERLEAAE